MHLLQLGIKRKYLVCPNHELKHVGGGNIDVIGRCKLAFEYNDHKIIEDVYFIEGITKMFLSLHACKSLKIIPKHFPYPAIESDIPKNETNDSVYRTQTQCSIELKKVTPSVNKSTDSIEIPFEPKDENIIKLKEWLIHSFSNTVFNEARKPFPCMSCKPHHIHMKNDAGTIGCTNHTV